MRTTCTLVGNRVANAGFFLSFGEGNHKTNNAIHLVVDWDTSKEFFSNADIQLVDGAGKPPNFTAYQLGEIFKFCKQYAGFYAKDLEALNAPPS